MISIPACVVVQLEPFGDGWYRTTPSIAPFDAPDHFGPVRVQLAAEVRPFDP